MATVTKLYSRGNNDPGENQYETATIEVTLNIDTSGCNAGGGGGGSGGSIGNGGLFDYPMFRDDITLVGEDPESAGGGTEVVSAPASWSVFREAVELGADDETLSVLLKRFRGFVAAPSALQVCTGNVAIKLKYKATASTADLQFVNGGPSFALNDGGQGGNSAQLVHAAAGAGGTIGDTLTAEIDLAAIPCTGGKLRGDVGVEMRLGGNFTGIVDQRITYDIEITTCGVIAKSNLSAVQLNPTRLIGRIDTPLHDITPPAGGGAPPEAPYPPLPGVGTNGH